jgi:TorA maturation chaperone TorD
MPQTSHSQSANDIAATASVYRLLARLWMREVDLPLLQALSVTPLRDTFADAGGVLPEAIDQPTVDELAIDYCRLLIGPAGHLPPYQSVWQSGQLQSQPVTSMQTFIEITSYQPPTESSLTLPDHLALQLDLAGHIAEQFQHADRDTPDFATLDDLRRTYFATHLLWPPEFLQAIKSRSDTAFYRSLASLTESFLQQEAESPQS